jgi:hypothetical protein
VTDESVGAEALSGPTAGFDWKGALGPSHGRFEKLISAKGWKGPGEALESYAGLESMLGQDRVVLPGKDAKPGDWDRFWTKLGRPEKPEGYAFAKPQGFDGYSDDFAQAFRGEAHRHGLSAKQAAALHDWWVDQTQEVAQSAESERSAAASQAASALKTEMEAAWGLARDEKLGAARRAARHFGLAEAELSRLESLGGSMKLLSALASIGEGLKEDRLAGGSASAVSPAGARAELARLEADKDFRAAYLDRGHPGHGEAVRRMTELALRAAPGAIGHGYR